MDINKLTIYQNIPKKSFEYFLKNTKNQKPKNTNIQWFMDLVQNEKLMNMQIEQLLDTKKKRPRAKNLGGFIELKVTRFTMLTMR